MMALLSYCLKNLKDNLMTKPMIQIALDQTNLNAAIAVAEIGENTFGG